MSGCFVTFEKPCATGSPVIIPVTCTTVVRSFLFLLYFVFKLTYNLDSPMIGETFLSILGNGIQWTGVLNLS